VSRHLRQEGRREEVRTAQLAGPERSADAVVGAGARGGGWAVGGGGWWR
jgi:hypothetical protein